MSKKICILTQSHLCRNPRVVKEALALAAAGFKVTILTTYTFPVLLEEDLKLIEHSGVVLKAAVNMLPGEVPSWYRLKERLVRRLAGEVIARFGWESPYALGYDYRKNLKAALKERADLYLCHQEISTVIGCKLMDKGHRVGFDFEDWYSHDLLPEANRSRPIALLRKAERKALAHGVVTYTTSEAMARALAEFGECRKPEVLPNVFPIADRDQLDHETRDRVDLSRPSIHWYSQTIGPGRGIELIVQSLAEVGVPVELHLRGTLFPGFEARLVEQFPHDRGHQLYFHPLVPHRELLSRIAEHDIGLATEEYVPDSRNLTITNKILQYLQAGLAVVATDTLGQQEVAREAPGAVHLFRNADRLGLSGLLTELLSNPARLEQAKKAALEAARNRFCWEHQSPRLVAWITQALGKS